MENTSPIGSEELAVDAADQVAEAVPAEDEVAPQASQPVSTHVSSNINDEIDNEPIYADASHGMHSVSSDGGDRVESGIKINLTDIDLTAIEEDEVIPDKGKAHSMGRKLNIVLCAVAFLVMFIYLFVAGEGEQLKQLKASMSAWDLYNAVTDYASNNTDWDASDNRRGMLQGEALRFLMRERDIKNYSDIFA